METARSIKIRTDFSQGRRDKNEREYSSTSVHRSPLCLVWKTKSLELDTTVNAPCQSALYTKVKNTQHFLEGSRIAIKEACGGNIHRKL